MSKDSDRDGVFESLKEWEDHQFNSGYWVNRFSPFFPPKRTWRFWVITLIDAMLLIPAFLFSAYILLFVERYEYDLLLVTLLGVFSIMAALRSYRLMPDFAAMREERNKLKEQSKLPKRKERRKKIPKRRKDYQ